MAKIICFPIDNADSTLFHLNDDRLILVDYCNKPLIDGDKRINLEEELRSYLDKENKDFIDLVTFTHADDDHIHAAEDLFWMNYNKKYQSEDRIKIKTLAVPASFLLETGMNGTAKIIREEAKYRVKNGDGIIVFGYPEQLGDWFKEIGIDSKRGEKIIVRAGECLPGYSEIEGNVEIFIHSPFSFNMEGEDIPRNGNCVMWHMTFFENGSQSRFLLGGDLAHEDWANVIYMTKKNKNMHRLEWDSFHISHHCSYKALSDDKGKDKTEPTPIVSELFELGTKGSTLISSSKIIPSNDEDIQPPHRQAATYYKEVAKKYGNEDNFVVTMQWPEKDSPKPIIITTSAFGFKISRNSAVIGGASTVVERQSPRLG